jgi:hypothetical protein
MMRARWLVLAALASGCSSRDEIKLHYQLVGIDPTQVVRVETVIGVDPSDSRRFFAEQPYRSVATGVGYEVRDVDGSGKLHVLITHDNTLGYVFTPSFTFTLLPPVNEAAPPLVLVARAVSATDEIGETMPISVAFGAGRSYDVPIPDQRCGGTTVCANDEKCCGTGCARLLTDAAHCGDCNNACHTGENCSGGNCRCAGGSACGAGQTCCAMGCFDTANDPFHCGACDKACAPGESCAGGMCHCNGGAACAAGSVCCAGGCSATGCLCGTTTCTTSQVCCPGGGAHCADLTSSDGDCGMCGHACTTPLTCSAGACGCHGTVCVTGDQCCTSGCAHVQDDPNNCGACEHQCQPGETCGASACHCGSGACMAGQTCCGSTCVDLMSDAANCGTCGHACFTGETCSGGNCSCAGGRACVGNETCCPSAMTGGGGGCFDLANDPNHCGSCTRSCNGAACIGGNCQVTSCNPACTNGNTCDPSTGMCLCQGKLGCSGANTCCPTGCADLQIDPANCGACGRGLVNGEYCCAGTPTPPSSANCGSCGRKCGGLSQCCICGTNAMCVASGLVCNCVPPTPP